MGVLLPDSEKKRRLKKDGTPYAPARPQGIHCCECEKRKPIKRSKRRGFVYTCAVCRLEKELEEAKREEEAFELAWGLEKAG